jgi:hypothetical protein
MNINDIRYQDFIDFTFDGLSITEFGMAAIMEGSRYSANLAPSFSNVIDNVNGKDGVDYYGTEVESLSISFTVMGDNITARQLNNFKQHFVPGKIGKLTTNEESYKYCYATLDKVPIFNFIPFDTITTINGVDYPDILYKGDISLDFIVYDPKFYSDYVMIDNTVDGFKAANWLLGSGIPLKTWLVDKDVFLPDGRYIDGVKTPMTDISSVFYVYNAGNATAKTIMQFDYSPAFIVEGGHTDEVAWSDIYIANNKNTDVFIMKKPRPFVDVDNAINTFKAYKDTWATNKTKAIEELKTKLDSQLTENILLILQADETTGITLANKINALHTLVNVTWSMKFDGTKIDARMTGLTSIILAVDGATVICQAADIDESIGDVHNGCYIKIDGSHGYSLNDQGEYEIDYQIFGAYPLVNGNPGPIDLTNLRIEFKYNYT